MVKKLMWAIAQKSWSLILKAAAVALLWAASPWWLFATAALVFYVVPWLRAGKMLPWLALFFGVSYILPATLWTVLYIAVLYWAMLGIKELWVIDRKRATTTMALLVLFPFVLAFSESFVSWQSGSVWWWLAALTILYAFLALITFKNYKKRNFPRRRAKMLALFSSLLFWQVGAAVVFLPLDMFLQVALLFAFGAMLLVAGSEYMAAPISHGESIAGSLTRARIFLYGSFFGVVVALVLATLP